MKYSVIATSFNDSAEIESYLRYIVNQSVSPSEVIIVDGGSKDDTVSKIIAFAEKNNINIRVISDRGRLNISQGYNIGVKESHNDHLVITGIGNIYDKDFCKYLIDCYEGGDYDMVYCPTFGVDQNNFSKHFNSVFLRGKKGKRYPFPSNRAVLIDKKVFERAGLFYEHFVYAGEDTEFFQRVYGLGYRIGYTEKAIMHWFTPSDFNQYKKKWKVNAIADLQLLSKRRIVMDALIKTSLLIIVAVLFCMFADTVYPYVMIFFGLLFLMLRYHTANVQGIFLRIASDYYLIWYRIKNWKYGAREYHFDTSKISRL